MDFWFPKAIEAVTAESRRQAECEVDMDLALRLVHAILFSPLFLITLAATTTVYRDHSGMMWAVTASGLANLIFRALLILHRKRLYAWNARVWRTAITLAVAWFGFTNGFMVAAVTYWYGLNCWPCTLNITWLCGCTGLAISSYVPNGFLHRVHLASHVVPALFVVWFFAGAQGTAVACAFLILLSLSYLQGLRLHSEYWSQVVQNFREREHSRELEIARQAAEQANRAQSLFIANMSHEIRTPLHGVIGMMNLAMETRSELERRDLLSTGLDSANYLLELINEILDFSKIEAGKLVIEFGDMDLQRLVSETVAPFRIQAEQKGLQLTCEISPAVPALVRGDCVRVRQILVNLLGNALKFTSSGSIRLCVNGAGDGSHDITFSVHDTGIGIPEDKQEIIFEAFSQGDSSTTRRFGGTGLGLTICSRLVSAMSGRIWVESKPGPGSSFYFVLPFLAPQNNAVPVDASRPLSSSEAAALQILLVEDNVVNQKLGLRLLEKAGHRVRVAGNGREAVACAEDQQFDLILMDLQMPEMDGLDATTLIRERERRLGIHTPIVALTAHALPEHEQSCRAVGMDGYLTKPLQKEKLFEQIDRLRATQFAA